MAMTGLATPGNENRADETNPILGFQSRNRKHEESMTYTIFSEEANCGGRRFRVSGLRGGRLGLGAFGLDALQVLNGLPLQAAGVIDAALEPGLGGGTLVEGHADGAVGAGVIGVLHYVDEDLGIDSVEAAEAPGGADDVVDQGALDGGLGLAILVEPFGEGGESGGILAGDDARFGVDTGFERVHAGDGLALGSEWACGVFRVAAVSFDLTKCSHFLLCPPCYVSGHGRELVRDLPSRSG